MTEPRYSVVSEVTFPLPRWVKASFPVFKDGEARVVLLAAKEDAQQVEDFLVAAGFSRFPTGRGFRITEYGDGDGFDHINEREREDEAIWQEHQRESEAPYRR